MFEKVEAQSANENNEETQEKVDRDLIVAPTSSIISQNEVRGLGQLSRDDLTIQRIKLLQAMSDEVSSGSGNVGEFYNTLSGVSYGTKFIFTPIARWKSRTLFNENRDDQPICRSSDGFRSLDGNLCEVNCPHDANLWVNGDPPRCAEAQNYLILPNGEQFPAIISFMRSAIKSAKNFNVLLLAAKSDLWLWEYELTSVKQNGTKGAYFLPKVVKHIVDGKPVATDEETRQIAEQFFHWTKTGQISEYDEEPPF